jgi:hypothetical protein
LTLLNKFEREKQMRKILSSSFFIVAVYVYGSAADTASMNSALADLEKSGSIFEGMFFSRIAGEGEKATPFLKSHANHSNLDVRHVIFNSLSRLGASCDGVESSLASSIGSSMMPLKISALSYIEQSKCKALKADVIKTLDSEKNSFVLAQSIKALGAIGDSSEANILKTFQEDGSKGLLVQLAAAGALARMGDTYDVGLLLKGLKSTDSMENQQALYACYFVKDANLANELTPFLSATPPASQMARIAGEEIKLNQTNPSQSERQSNYFLWLQSPYQEVRGRAANQILRHFRSEENISTLKTIALDSSHKASPEVFSALMEAGLLTPEDIKKSVEALMNEQPHQ